MSDASARPSDEERRAVPTAAQQPANKSVNLLEYEDEASKATEYEYDEEEYEDEVDNLEESNKHVF